MSYCVFPVRTGCDRSSAVRFFLDRSVRFCALATHLQPHASSAPSAIPIERHCGTTPAQNRHWRLPM